MSLVEKFFEVDGVVFGGYASITSGDLNPELDGLNLPVGSLYLCSDGSMWGLGAQGWEIRSGLPDFVLVDDELVSVEDELVTI